MTQTAITLNDLPPEHQLILKGIFAAIRQLECSLAERPLRESSNPHSLLKYIGDDEFGDRATYHETRSVRIDHEGWNGGPVDPSTSKRIQRTLARLETLAIVQRVALVGKQRRTHVKLAPRGLQLLDLMERVHSDQTDCPIGQSNSGNRVTA